MSQSDPSTTTQLLARTFRYAAANHVDQLRKNEAKEPSINHLAKMAELVAEATGGVDPI